MSADHEAPNLGNNEVGSNDPEDVHHNGSSSEVLGSEVLGGEVLGGEVLGGEVLGGGVRGDVRNGDVLKGEHETAVVPVATPHRLVSARVFLVALLVGGAFIAFGIRSALSNSRDSHPFALAVHIVGFDLGHDLLFAPVLLLIAVALKRVLPATVRGAVAAAASATLVVSTFSYPLIRRWGQRRGNSSTLPLRYGLNLAIIVTAICIVAGVVIARRIRIAKDTSLRTDTHIGENDEGLEAVQPK
jgi:hypothetical protein